MVKEARSGIVYLREGKIVHAEAAVTRGTEALLEIASWGDIEFAYDSSERASETIALPWDEALIQAAVRAKEGKATEQAPTPIETSTAEEPPPKKRGFFSVLRRS
jgi:hypothetical protein